MWARIMRERFAAKNPKAQMMRFHTQTAGSTLTAQQVDNNVVRVTIQALAAVFGRNTVSSYEQSETKRWPSLRLNLQGWR